MTGVIALPSTMDAQFDRAATTPALCKDLV
jgi:hypothetical protein